MDNFIITNNGLDGITFTIGSEKVLISGVDTINSIIEHLDDYIYYHNTVTELIEKCDLVENNIDEYLANVVVSKDDKIFYDVGDDFAYILEDVIGNRLDNTYTKDKVELDFNNAFPEITDIFFEATEEFLHVYTVNKESATTFLKYTTDKYIVPFVNDIK